MKTILQRLANELPTIAAGIAAILYVFGFEVPDDVVADIVEHAEAVLAFLLWLHVRRNVNGPVTLHEIYSHGDGHDADGDLE